MRRASLAAALLLAVGMVGAIVSEAVPSVARAETAAPRRAIDPALGINNLDHLIFIVQENRSFDHYFGTFPGADGIPKKSGGGGFDVCVRDPEANGVCRRPYHDRNVFDEGGPHNVKASRITVNHGAMDGQLRALVKIGNACRANPTRSGCKEATQGPNGTPDVMGFHTQQRDPELLGLREAIRLAGPDVRAVGLLDAPGAPRARLRVVGDVPGSERSDELPLRSEVPRAQRGRRRPEVLDPRRRQASPVPVGGHHVAAPQRGRQLGLLRR